MKFTTTKDYQNLEMKVFGKKLNQKVFFFSELEDDFKEVKINFAI